MSNFWLYDGTNTLVIEDNVSELEFGTIKRDMTVESYIGAHGGIISGTGNLKERNFQISRKERITSGDSNFWNTRRQAYLQWFLNNKYKDIWLYVQDATASKTIRTKVYCQQIGSEKIKSLGITGDRGITLVSPSGIFENTSITDYTGYDNKTGYGTITLSPAIDSMLDIPCIWRFTPQAAVNTIKIWIAESIGFTLTGIFASGEEIIYNHIENTLTISGIEYDIENYLTSGGRFSLPVDTETVYYYFDALVDFEFSFYERYV